MLDLYSVLACPLQPPLGVSLVKIAALDAHITACGQGSTAALALAIAHRLHPSDPARAALVRDALALRGAA